ncbi:uncharacterized protein LOC121995260 [Zingiber officinale]|uniref:Uncharacterized protein n=1 Tax=Zingiber officinale TaxID=94328 RepID=A0A8J5GDI9_ZINOF|nr:uncharacterized protein LOC121995260 [Zingiber officinale]KAG6501349.1 hypothetical protein ZIOFF_041228 [Zingiber officinale]
MESTGAGKRLWHVVSVVLYMIRKGLSKDKLMMDLHLLRKRGKVIGKALGNLMTLLHHRGYRRRHHDHHHHHRGVSLLNSGFSCRSLDPDVPFYDPRDVEFSCSATPTYPSFDRNHRRSHHRYDDYEAMAFAEALDMLNYEEDCAESSSVAPSPSPEGRLWRCQKSPVTERRLVRVTDSPFPVKEEEGEVEKHIDEQAEQFIRRFYEQLRLQQRMNPMTPEYEHRWNEAAMGLA